MKVLLICGSPRKHGNTAKILHKIKEQSIDSQNTNIIYLMDYHINGCCGCAKCQESLDEIGCVQHDQTKELLQLIMDVDAIVYGTPLYGHSYSGQLKIFMDRHVALFKFLEGNCKTVNEMVIRSFIAGKAVGLVVSCQGPEEVNTDLIKMQFDKFCESSLTKCFGKYIFPLCDPSTEQTEYSLQKIEQIVTDIWKTIQS